MKLIIIDGLDAAGKDTHAQLIKEGLKSNGEKVIVRSHPENDNIFGRMAKNSLFGSNKIDKLSASFFYALDILRTIKNCYRKDKCDTLILVRYLMGTAYLPYPFSKLSYRLFKKILPTSSYMFLLDLKPKEALKRLEDRGRKEIFENQNDLDKVRNEILRLADGDWHIINTERPIEDVYHDIETILNGNLKKITQQQG